MNKHLLTTLLICLVLHAFGKKKPKSLREINESFYQLTEDLLRKPMPENEILNASYIPVFSDATYRSRMEYLNEQTPIQLDYNDIVRRYIEAYAVKHREKTSKILMRSEVYFPIFEEYLDKYDLPLELKYLSVIESALDPKAKSKSGAMGLWQFMFNASKMFDLRITSYIDERMDPEKSTEAACKYLQYLYRIFGDWQLALAAYNGGPGVVRDAIQRSGGKTNFWEISPYLPLQTKNYVPAFIAVNYILNFNKEHNILAEKNKYSFFRLSTVQVNRVTSLKQISQAIDLPVRVIREMNPIYKNDIIPECELPVQLILPIEKIGQFIDNEEMIYSFNTDQKKYMDLQKELSSTDKKLLIIHRVDKGEYFHKIAMRYSCTTHNIMEWNKMLRAHIFEGQQLKIWVNPSDLLTEIADRENAVMPPKVMLYTIREKDSLTSIADEFQIDKMELYVMNDRKDINAKNYLKIVK